MIRAILVGAWFFPATLFVLLVSLLRPFNPKNGELFGRVIPPVALWLMNMKLIVRGADRLAAARPCVYLANHQSIVDLFVYSGILPPNSITIGKKSIRWVPIFGWMYWLAGHVMIDRSNHERAIATMNEAYELIRRKGWSVLIFPEGTRSYGRGLLPFKKGAFHLAVETGLPIQPFVSCSFHKYIDLNRWSSGTCVIEALDPIPTKGKTADDVDALLAVAQARMQEGVDKLDAELSAAAK